jgi:hypothetical protein
MINAELTLNLFQKPEKLSMQLILDNLRQRYIQKENTLTGGFFVFFGNSTLLHLPPLTFHCVGGCWDQTQRIHLQESKRLNTYLPVGTIVHIDSASC